MSLDAYAPSNSPVLWSTINGFCWLWSTLLAIGILFESGPLDRLEGTRSYLVYNFGTTAIWFLEVGLTIYHLKKASNYSTIVELIVAVYLLGDSIHLFWRWRQADENFEGELFDALINSIAYGYLLWKSSTKFRSGMQDEPEDYVRDEQEDYGAVV